MVRALLNLIISIDRATITILIYDEKITIPVEIRKQLNLKPGDKVIFMEENGKITLANSSGRVNYQASNDLVTDSSCLQEKLKEMANDSDIQKEINAINQEFESTERDGLEQA